MAVKFAESVPYSPSIRISSYYSSSSNPWLYVYRYQGDQSKIDKMVAAAREMAANGSKYYYENPGFGPKGWCCVTVCSYWVYVGLGLNWVMGSSRNEYFWSPRYGGSAYDDFLINHKFKKYNFAQIGRDGLRPGDILQRWDHAVTVVEGNGSTEEGFDVAKLKTLKKGSTGNEVKNLQALLNVWLSKTPKLVIDGDFGDITEEHLKSYQKLQGLYVDGICGEKTWSDILIG